LFGGPRAGVDAGKPAGLPVSGPDVYSRRQACRSWGGGPERNGPCRTSGPATVTRPRRPTFGHNRQFNDLVMAEPPWSSTDDLRRPVVDPTLAGSISRRGVLIARSRAGNRQWRLRTPGRRGSMDRGQIVRLPLAIWDGIPAEPKGPRGKDRHALRFQGPSLAPGNNEIFMADHCRLWRERKAAVAVCMQVFGPLTLVSFMHRQNEPDSGCTEAVRVPGHGIEQSAFEIAAALNRRRRSSAVGDGEGVGTTFRL